jgi:hypothetical protein
MMGSGPVPDDDTGVCGYVFVCVFWGRGYGRAVGCGSGGHCALPYAMCVYVSVCVEGVCVRVCVCVCRCMGHGTLREPGEG